MPDFVDSHCHLDFSDFDADRKDVLSRAFEKGLRWIVNIGAGDELKSAKRSLELAEKERNIFATVGIHPHDAKIWSPQVEAQIRELAKRPKVVAIGEIGLDFAKQYSAPELQVRAFLAQLELAEELGLPVVIHNRDAHQKTMEVLRAQRVSKASVMHCYSGSLEMAKELIEMDFYISIPGVVTFKNARALPEVVRGIPLERMLIETDCPFLTPEPYRGKRNEPCYVIFIAQSIAKIRGVSVEEVAEVTTENAKKVFNLY